MKKLLCFLLTFILCFGLVGCSNTSQAEEEIKYSELRMKLNAAHQMAEAGRVLGYDEYHEVILLAKEEWNYYNDLKMESQYYDAIVIWEALKKEGFSDAAAAGILGNIMAEVGGQTLRLDVTAGNSSYYGICQWSTKYFPEVRNTDLNSQINYLLNNMEETFLYYGFLHYDGFDYEIFKNLTDEKEAALAFAQCYERCSYQSYEVRQDNATKALEYFVY